MDFEFNQELHGLHLLLLSLASSAFPALSAMRLAPRAVCVMAMRRIGSSSAWRS
jgi:hypothetical protein